MERPFDVRRLPDVPFHTTAYGGPDLEAEPVECAELGDSVAMTHDLTARGFAGVSLALPGAFDSCDVIYTELPWPATLKSFNERAGVDDVTWSKLIEAAGDMIDRMSCPILLLAGYALRRSLPTPRHEIATSLFGGDDRGQSNCVALVYNAELPLERSDSHADLIRWLAGTYDRVGDPACGYGFTGRLFRGEGKSFVLSDYNARCIGYIAENADKWWPR